MEDLKLVNQRLIDYFGIDTVTGEPNWRIVWSENQFEKRLTYYTDSGVQLLTPEYRTLPKYRQWISHKWVLEKLTVVPYMQESELTTKTSYEPAFVFETKNGERLPYNFLAAKFVIDTINEAMSGEVKVELDPERTPQLAADERLKRIVELEAALYGNESDLGDALATKNAVVINNRDMEIKK